MDPGCCAFVLRGHPKHTQHFARRTGVHQRGTGTAHSELSTGSKFRLKKPRQPLLKTTRIDYSSPISIRVINSIVAWRQQIGAGTWPLGLRLIAFAKTQKHLSFWRAICWQIQTMLASDLNLPRISLRIFRNPKRTSSPLAKVKYFLNCATKADATLRYVTT